MASGPYASHKPSTSTGLKELFISVGLTTAPSEQFLKELELGFSVGADSALRLQGNPHLKFIIEVLKREETGEQVLHVFAHSASSADMVRETMKSVLKSPQWPPEANGFRILGPDGAELYRWPEKPC